ncbi:serine/threonine protein kinase [Candidatus Margulisiibacteriota bacterium]
MQDTWKILDHDTILDTIESTIGEKLTSLLLQRNSYINRVYELEKADTKARLIVKFYRPGRWTKEMILEEHQFLDKLAEKELPVIPPLKYSNNSLFFLKNIPFAIFPKKGGRAFDEFDKDSWQEIGRLLARLHIVGETIKDHKRIIWRPDIATRQHLDLLLNKGHVPVEFKDSLKKIVDLFINKATPLFEKEKMFLIHGDCHKGNLIHRPGEGVFIVDFDDISVGPAVQDLWMLLPGSPEESELELGWFLEGYRTFGEFDQGSLSLVPALKIMRIIHYAGWCAMQSNDPDFKHHFPEWGTTKYWNGLIRDVQEIVYSSVAP